MIITAVGPEELIEKLREEVAEIEKELESYGAALAPVLVQSRKELVRYKLLGFKTKPPQGEKLSDSPPIVLHKSLLVFSKDFEREVAEALKEYKEELESLVSFLELKKEELKDHIFFVFTKGAKIIAVYVLSPTAPSYESIKRQLEGRR